MVVNQERGEDISPTHISNLLPPLTCPFEGKEIDKQSRSVSRRRRSVPVHTSPESESLGCIPQEDKERERERTGTLEASEIHGQFTTIQVISVSQSGDS